MPDRIKNWAHTSLSSADALVLELEGFEPLKIVAATTRFGKNSIPEAVMVPQIGRLGSDGVTYAALHRIAKQIKRGTKGKLYFRPTGEWHSSGARWPGDRRVIFEGRFNGPTNRRRRGMLQMGLSFTHWLGDLQAGSILSADINARSSIDMRDPIVFSTAVGSGAKATSVYLSHLVGSTTVENLIREDVTVALKTLLVNIAGRDNVVLSTAETAGTVNRRPNQLALEALERIEGPSDDRGKEYKHGVPSALATRHLAVYRLPGSLATAALRQPVTSLGATNFWNAIIRWYCSTLMLQLVPLVDRALLVPDCPVLDKYYNRRFTPNDIVESSTSLVNPERLRGVGLYAKFASNAGAMIGEDGRQVDGSRRVAGQYLAKAEELQDGGVAHLEAPAWMNDISYGGYHVPATTPTDGTMPTSTSKVRAPAPSTEPKPTDILAMGTQLFDDYAKALFGVTCLSYSSLRFTSRLRFDICPGMMMALEPAAESAAGLRSDELATGHWGQVIEVANSYSVNPAACGTEVQLGYVRSEAERDTEDYSLKEHPLYGDNVFLGAPLVTEPDDAWGFPDLET